MADATIARREANVLRVGDTDATWVVAASRRAERAEAMEAFAQVAPTRESLS